MRLAAAAQGPDPSSHLKGTPLPSHVFLFSGSYDLTTAEKDADKPPWWLAPWGALCRVGFNITLHDTLGARSSAARAAISPVRECLRLHPVAAAASSSLADMTWHLACCSHEVSK